MSTMNYDRFINQFSARRVQYCLRDISRQYTEAAPGTIFFGGGMPNNKTFPFKKIDIKISDALTIELEGKPLDLALQYQPTPGYIPLVAELKALQTRVHGLDSTFWESRELLVTTGSLDGINKALSMLLEDGDPIVMQEPNYPGVSSGIRPFQPRFISAVEDECGVCPDKLRAVLLAEGTPQQVRAKNRGVPKLIYLNPTGSNPTGTTLSTQRRREIYKIACEYDLLILEDDPYYFLTFEGERPVSFLSLDTEGRVLRFDSLSKVLSSGLRLGFVTSPKPLSERIELHMQVSTMHTSGLSQVLVHTLLTEWKEEGFSSHLKSIQDFYMDQRDKTLAAAKKHLTGLAEWTVPQAGMFLWLRVLGVSDVRDMVQKEGVARGVILVSGHYCMNDTAAPCPYVRISFSTASEQEMDVGFSRIAEMIKAELQKKNNSNSKTNNNGSVIVNATNRVNGEKVSHQQINLKVK